MKKMVTSLKRSHSCTVHAPNPAAGHHRPMPLLETPGYLRTSLGQSFVGSVLLSPGSWCAQSSVGALQESVSQSCVSSDSSMVELMASDLFQEDLCHTHTQSPRPCGRSLLTHTSTGECWIPPKKIPHIQGQRRSSSKTVGGVNSHLESNSIPTRDVQRAQRNLVCTRTQGSQGLRQNCV